MMIYGAVISLICLFLMIMAFYQAEEKGRIGLAVLAVLVFLVPALFPSSTLSWITLIAKFLIAVGCYLYLKMRSGLF